MLSEKARNEILKLTTKYPDKRSALMPALHLAQREVGHLPDAVLDDIAAIVGVSRTEASSVATFYTMYAREPKGEHTVMFCTDLPCALRGADEMLEHIEHKLGCKAGQTTADGKITLRDAECLGGCDHAPVMLVDGEKHFQDLSIEKLDEILEELKNM
ncbi:MAG: NADH-quinone oxidoreductase subunit NuoE [Chloroflexi bacterium]|nr:NADH-quinone oxidoreductase subunit NuoE [Chloroflexota bacterium]